MKRMGEYLVVVSGVLVLVSILVIFYAVAFMRSGHPPASGIVALIVILGLSPVAILATVAGLLSGERASGLPQKLVHTMLGVNVTFVFIVACIFVFKVILGAPI